MSKHTIKVGIIGAGGNTRSRHIPGLQAIEGVEIAGVVNRSRESSQKVADKFGIARVYDDWTQAIADPETDAILIGTWPYLHCRATLAALANDKHVMCEARMAMNAREAHQMLEASQSKPNLITQIVPAPFTLRVDNTVKRLLAQGYIGTLLAVEAREGGRFLDRQAKLGWRQNFDLGGYNTMGLGIWYETVMRWVGPAKNVMALGQTFAPMRLDASGTLRATNVPEHLDVIAQMECGAQAHFQMSVVSGLAQDNGIYLFGDNGTLRIANDKIFGGQRGDKELSEIEVPAEEAGGWRVEAEWVNAIRGHEAISHTTFADGVKYMEFTEAVARSNADGCRVSLPLQR